MYTTLACFAGMVLAYSLVSEKVERLSLSGPIVFVLAGVLLSLGVFLGSFIWTSTWAPAVLVTEDQVPVIVAESAVGENPEQDELVEQIVEAPPPAPRRAAVLVTPPAETELPTIDAEVFDGEPIEAAVAWDELVNQFPKIEPKVPKPEVRKPRPAQKSSRVAMKLTPVRKARA